MQERVVPDQGMKAVGPGERGEKSRTKEPGRKCRVLGCQTLLSVYNRADTCFAHAEPVFSFPRGKSLDPFTDTQT